MLDPLLISTLKSIITREWSHGVQIKRPIVVRQETRPSGFIFYFKGLISTILVRGNTLFSNISVNFLILFKFVPYTTITTIALSQ